MAYLFDPRRPADAKPAARAMAMMGLHAPTNARGPDGMRWDANGVAARAEMGPARHPPRNPLIANMANTPSETTVVHSVRYLGAGSSAPDAWVGRLLGAGLGGDGCEAAVARPYSRWRNGALKLKSAHRTQVGNPGATYFSWGCCSRPSD